MAPGGCGWSDQRGAGEGPGRRERQAESEGICLSSPRGARADVGRKVKEWADLEPEGLLLKKRDACRICNTLTQVVLLELYFMQSRLGKIASRDMRAVVAARWEPMTSRKFGGEN